MIVTNRLVCIGVLSCCLFSTTEAALLTFANTSYWDSFGYIQQLNTDTNSITTYRSIGDGLASIAINESTGDIYWSDTNSHSIDYSNLNTPDQSPSNLVDLGLGFGWGLALSTAGKLFWTDPRSETIESINTDGTGRETLFSAVSTSIALDEANEKIYFENRTTAAIGSIMRANLDGTGLEVVIDNVPTMTGIAVDNVNGFIYWTSSAGLSNGNGGVYRVGFDGIGFSELFVMGSNLDTFTPALDIVNEKLYWAQEISVNDDAIFSMNLDGTGVENLVVAKKGTIRDIVLSTVEVAECDSCMPAVPVPSAIWLFSSGLFGLIGFARRKIN